MRKEKEKYTELKIGKGEIREGFDMHCHPIRTFWGIPADIPEIGARKISIRDASGKFISPARIAIYKKNSPAEIIRGKFISRK